MASWDVYRLSCDPTSKERRNLGIEHAIEVNDEYMRDIVKNINEEYKKDPQGLGEVGLFTVLFEGAWYFRGKPVVFIESPDLVRGLYETTYKIDFDSICLPFDVTSFSFPSDVTIEGHKLPPVIFQRLKTSDGGTRISSVIREGFGSCSMVTICSQEHLERALMSRPLDISSPSDYHVELTEEEAKIHSIMFRICIGLSAYMSAFPQCLRKGFPEAMTVRDSRIYQIDFNKVPPVTLGLHERFRNGPSAHFRTGHFRTLRDDKYRRNPDGTYRSVWVSNS